MTSKRLSVMVYLFMVCAVAPARAQATDCNDPAATPEQNARAQARWESRSSPVYADATALARDLGNRGIKVQCIRRSKEERLFPNQEGAAWIMTDKGVFEVWFMRDQEAAAAAYAKVTTPPLPVNLPSGPREISSSTRTLSST
jgi:hypothetical protein